MKIKVFEAFAGYGSQHIALKRLAKDFPDFSCEVVGISEIDINKLTNIGLSDSAIYRLAGNSITISVLYHVFRKMFCELQSEDNQLTLF